LPGGGFQVRAWPGHGLWAGNTLPFVAAATTAAATDVSASPRGLVATLPAGADPWPVLEAARAAVGLA
jgi:hypothetical protein